MPIKVLFLCSDLDGGVGYYRLILPASTIKDRDIDIDVRVTNDYSLPILNPDFLRQYKIIYFNKMIPFSDEKKNEIGRAHV